MNREVLRMEHVSTDSTETGLNDFNISVLERQIVRIVTLDDTGLEKMFNVLEYNDEISSGKIYIREKMVNSTFGKTSQRNSVTLVDYRNRLVNDLSVLDNMAFSTNLSSQFLFHKNRFRTRLLWMIDEYDLDFNPDQRCEDLSVLQRCIVQILRAVMYETRLIILQGFCDFLSDRELQYMLLFTEKLRETNHTVLYITNRFDDADDMCDKTVVMRNGSDIKTFWKESRSRISYNQILYKDQEAFLKMDDASGKKHPVLRFCGVTAQRIFGLSFEMYSGECLCIRMNAECQRELLFLLTRGEKPESGWIEICGKRLETIRQRSLVPEQMMVIQEDALRTMLMYDLSYIENLCLFLGRKTGKMIVSYRYQKSICKEYSPYLGSVLGEETIQGLSKKEKYTLIYTRIELMKPKLVVIVKPFIEVDHHIKQHLNNLIRRLLQKGIAVLITTANVYDCTTVADRIIETNAGVYTGAYKKEDFNSLII